MRGLDLSYSNNSSNSTTGISVTFGVVVDVVLDETHPRIKKTTNTINGTYTELDTELIGSVYIRPIDDLASNKAELKPHRSFTNDIDLPLVGETVRIWKDGSSRYYERLSSSDINTGGAKEDGDIKLFPNSEKTNTSKTKDYSITSQTGTTNTTNDGGTSDRKTTIGEYFEPTHINPLKFWEGDRVIQSRFGQSIRFSGYNNPDNEFSPTIILRNRQNDLQKLKGQVVQEDINRDGSTILLSSNKYKLDFQQGRVDDKGKSDFETKPIKAKLPQEYVGYDQMLLNSERIILSAKSQEMLFFSKGNYGFISDGKFTIDNGNGGADLDFGDDVNITTDRNNGDFTILTGDGNIFLNTTEKTERIVRGDTLVELLGELIDAINQQVYNTPAGPSAVGPTNRSTFNDIKSKLQDALSTLNYTE